MRERRKNLDKKNEDRINTQPKCGLFSGKSGNLKGNHERTNDGSSYVDCGYAASRVIHFPR